MHLHRPDKFSNPNVRSLSRNAWAVKEEALRTRIARTTESLKVHTRPLHLLSVGERVFLQNQRNNHPTKWDRSGTIVESMGHDQYRVKVDGSGRLTLSNPLFPSSSKKHHTPPAAFNTLTSTPRHTNHSHMCHPNWQ